MSYLMDAISNPRETITRLKTKGWSTDAIRQCYPTFSAYAVLRSSKLKGHEFEVMTKQVGINDKQLLKLYDIVKGGDDIDSLAKRIEVPLELCEDLGVAITMIIRMIGRNVQREQYRRMVLMIANKATVTDIAEITGVPYNDVRKFIKDVYNARPSNVRGV